MDPFVPPSIVSATRFADRSTSQNHERAWATPGATGSRCVHQSSDHLGVTDDQISRIAAPAGDSFEDEPRQG
jgi:hypothetical protein